MEVCIDSVESAINAENGGATRVELCANLVEGGTTPSTGMLLQVKKQVQLPVFVIIRPRGGDFCYSELEFEVMKQDLLNLKSHGADGFVFGILKRDGSVNMERCSELVALARPQPVTFHRAIDVSCNILESLEVVVSLGFERVLTSGGENSALEGAMVIKSMTDKADGRIIVVPGGGINERNLQRILDLTGAREFHASARRSQASDMEYRSSRVCMGASFGPSEYTLKVTDTDKVKQMMWTYKDTSK